MKKLMLLISTLLLASGLQAAGHGENELVQTPVRKKTIVRDGVELNLTPNSSKVFTKQEFLNFLSIAKKNPEFLKNSEFLKLIGEKQNTDDVDDYGYTWDNSDNDGYYDNGSNEENNTITTTETPITTTTGTRRKKTFTGNDVSSPKRRKSNSGEKIATRLRDRNIENEEVVPKMTLDQFNKLIDEAKKASYKKLCAIAGQFNRADLSDINTSVAVNKLKELDNAFRKYPVTGKMQGQYEVFTIVNGKPCKKKIGQNIRFAQYRNNGQQVLNKILALKTLIQSKLK